MLNVLAPICNDKWLEKLRLVDPPIHEDNARVCSEHFTVFPVLEGYGPSRRTLKADAVLTIFLSILHLNIGSSAKQARQNPNIRI